MCYPVHHQCGMGAPMVQNNYYGPTMAPQLNSLMNSLQANSLGAMGIQSAVNQFTNPLFSNPASAGLLANLPVTSMVLGGGNNGMMNGFGSGFGQPGMGMMSPFSMSTMPFGNPMLSPQMLQYEQMMQQQQQQQQPKPTNPLKIFGIAIGGLLLLNMLTKGSKEGEENGGGLGNILKILQPVLGGLISGGVGN